MTGRPEYIFARLRRVARKSNRIGEAISVRVGHAAKVRAMIETANPVRDVIDRTGDTEK